LERLGRRLPQLQGRGMVNMWGMTEGGGFFTVATGADLAPPVWDSPITISCC
jgi:hypothetical protein